MELLKKGLVIIPIGIFFMANSSGARSASLKHPALDQGMECSSCHEDGRTRETKPKDHQAGWKKTHGEVVKRYKLPPSSVCLVCHTEGTCATCHQQEKPADHTQYWRLKGHGVATGLDRKRCLACHRGADFCQRCHADTRPQNHTSLWGAPTSRHCLSCHYPLTSAGAQVCAVCHTGTPSHSSAPPPPSNSLHVSTADCRSCHAPLRHPDNGSACSLCHRR